MAPRTRLRYRLPRSELVRLAMPNHDETSLDGVTVTREEMSQGTFPKEKVTVRALGQEVSLLVKYDDGVDHFSHGHRGGLPYEARIYETILERAEVTTPHLAGVGIGESNSNWLAVEYLTGSVRLKSASEDSAMASAARWLGRFHDHGRRMVSQDDLRLQRYDIDYYAGWAVRTAEKLSGDAGPWLRELCRAFTEEIPEILSWPTTVIHGEFYPNNIMWRDGDVYPVDWESAAVAFGEIDVASLSEGWPIETVRAIEQAYATTRWPGGPPRGYEARLDAARAYLQLRWLAEYERTRSPTWRVELLRRSAVRLGWL